MVRICAEEGYHMKQCKEMCIRYAQVTPKQRAMIQDAKNRWWWPSLMMFGLHDDESTNSEVLLKWGIKTKSNDTLRQEFVNELVTELHEIGLTVPDSDLYYDEETGNWVYGSIDWDEFWQVIRGNGPINNERLATRRKAHEDGRWVREALVAYAAKKTAGEIG
jgi:ring-1,2-phenylacetyl-CoA epoxidase subunit PaaA